MTADHHHVLREATDGDRFAWRARIRAHPVALFWYRIGVGVAGALLMVAAALTGWLPGPGGIPLFLLGLAVWASEFAWAHRLLLFFRGWFERLKDLSPAQKRVFWSLVVVVILTSWYVAAWYAGVPTWLPDLVEHHVRALPGLE